ncbi:hypothetical protein MKZ38_006990 [Zalerion maritima]|uniref:MFS transporter n=1 Tax=Zalerion maritima TaxID=339359 RepID=A0AAD5WPE1_9PEZI|nr:hypothetical protein MKZ38_006990 [Zalerion maritima]
MERTITMPRGALAVSVSGLLIFADSIANLATSSLLAYSSGGGSSAEPGRWNRGTLSLVLATVSDFVGQIVLGYVADRKGHKHAVMLNAGSIGMASALCLCSLLTTSHWHGIITAVSPLMSVLGGGSHASAFLALVLLFPQSDARRTSFYFLTAAVTVVAQSAALFIAPWLVKRNPSLAFAVPILCCFTVALLASFSTPSISVRVDDIDRGNGDHTDGVYTPLLAQRQQEQTRDGNGLSPAELVLKMIARPYFQRELRQVNSNSMLLVVVALFLAGISKSTKPLFKTYIQHRVGTTAATAGNLWSLRAGMSLAIFGLVLPTMRWLAVGRNVSAERFSLAAARYSIILMGCGAMLIGLADTMGTLVAALVINTLGCAMDICLLAFCATTLAGNSNVAGRALMGIASVESLGTLLGIGTLYWVYQWSLGYAGQWLGGLPYYLCGTIYAIVAGVIWSINP